MIAQHGKVLPIHYRFVSRHLRLLILLLPLAANTGWASDVCPKAYGSKNPVRITLSRFGPLGSFQNSVSQSWLAIGGLFHLDEGKETYRHGFGPNDTIFAEQQQFPLAVMVLRNVLTPEKAANFLADSHNREPAQVNVLEMSEEIKTEELFRNIDSDRPVLQGGSHLRHSRQDHQTESVPISSLYSISGQVWQPSGVPSARFVAWETEEGRKDQRLDRRRYPIVYEWGRAARDRNGEILPLFAKMAMLNYIDCLANGGKLEDVYVTVHSLDERNSRLYQRMHPGSLYPKDWKNLDDALFIAPLKEMLVKYPGRLASAAIAKIIELSDKKLTDFDALHTILYERLSEWDELDFYSLNGPQAAPIILRDMSNLRAGFTTMPLRRAGVSQERAEAIFESILRLQGSFHTANDGSKYTNAADSLLTQFHYLDKNAVEISNLDPAMAKTDQYYTLSVLMSAFSYYIGKVQYEIEQTHGLTTDRASREALQVVKDRKVGFGVTSSDPLIEAQLKILRPDSRSEQEGTRLEDGSRAEPVPNKPYWYRDSRMYFFTAEQMHRLVLKYPQIYRAAGNGLREGRWQSHYLQSQTDFF